MAVKLPFQLTAARRRLDMVNHGNRPYFSFNSQPPEGGWDGFGAVRQSDAVSTHSRPKAAGCRRRKNHPRPARFNSQPPEGGWKTMLPNSFAHLSFNSQPPEGGWVYYDNQANPHEAVSTHSRPKAAGQMLERAK